MTDGAPAIATSVRITGVESDTPARVARPSAREHQDEHDTRSPAQRDSDRILYSAAWRRLGGVTQVITPFEDLPVLHNRLTHSEKVAQVSRSIAHRLVSDESARPAIKALGGLDVDVCEAAALAHDIGHPPFGHIGEASLDQVARDVLKLPDGFEGNAQTFRILSVGKIRSSKYEGLDLTMATLAATAKYPWNRRGQLQPDQHETALDGDPDYRRHWKKFSAYDAQADLLAQCRQFAPVGDEVQTIEASIMDVADDITYAVHDLEDFYLANILDIASISHDLRAFADNEPEDTPFTPLARRLATDYGSWADDDELREAASTVHSDLQRGFTRRAPSTGEKEAAARGRGSDLIGRYIAAVTVDAAKTLWPHGPHVGLKKKEWHEVQVLKEITRNYVVERPDIALLQRGQQHVIESLVSMLQDWLKRDRRRLPPRLLREVETAENLRDGKIDVGYDRDRFAPRGDPNRAILDYLCGFSDQQTMLLYYKLSGSDLHRVGSMFAI